MKRLLTLILIATPFTSMLLVIINSLVSAPLQFESSALCLDQSDEKSSKTEIISKRPMKIDDLFSYKRIADPQPSPDGEWIVYQVTTVNLESNRNSTNLWLVKADGSAAPAQLTNTIKSDRHPRWSPDGKTILFESTRSGENQLWKISIQGGEAVQITHLSTGASNAIWSPDGKKIAFVSAVYPEFSEKPFAESDKLNRDKIESIAKSPVKAKVFHQLFYRHWDEYVEEKRQHLFVMETDSTQPRDVTPGDRDAYPTSSTFSVGDDFTFSPDSNYLIFTAVPKDNPAWSTNHEIARVSIRNRSTQWETLTKNPAADSAPQFSPNGEWCAFRCQKIPGYEADKWNLAIVPCKKDGTWSANPQILTQDLDRSVDNFVWLANNTTMFFLLEYPMPAPSCAVY